MRKLDKVFSCLFAAFGVFALLLAAIGGAEHQLALAGICAVLSIGMWPWNGHEEND